MSCLGHCNKSLLIGELSKVNRMLKNWPVLRPLAGRFLQSIITLWLVTVLFFLVIELSPGDFAVQTAGQGTTPDMIEATRHELGLFASAPQRYVAWLIGLLTGDLGTSWWARRPILPLIAERLWHSAWLFSWAASVTIPLSMVLAFMAARWHDGRFDRASSMTALTIMSVPEFVVAYTLMGLLAVQFDMFPAYTMFALDMPWSERLHASVLPILSLIAVTVTPMFRLTRAALIRVLQDEYIEMAEIKGLTRWRILMHHAVPNALGPIANAIVLAMANLFFGLVVIEIIFSYPGLGKLMVTAAVLHDVPLVQACALIAATLYIGLNFVADMIGILANPRIRHPASPDR